MNTNIKLNEKSYDVIVIGGGMMGLVYACNVKLERPSTSILVLEKQDDCSYKVGESTLSAVVRMMFRLGLTLNQLEVLFENKGGLMFYHTDKTKSIEDCLELSIESIEETFQFDRRVVEILLMELAQNHYQIDVCTGCNVFMDQSIISGDMCTIVYGTNDYQLHQVTSKMVCDASGRASLLCRSQSPQDFFRNAPPTHFNTNCYWGYFEQVDDVPLETWQLPNTRHICFPGGWIWILRLNSYHQATNDNIRNMIKYVLTSEDDKLMTRNELSAKFNCPTQIVYSIGITINEHYDDTPNNITSWEKFQHLMYKYPMVQTVMQHYKPVNGVTLNKLALKNQPKTMNNKMPMKNNMISGDIEVMHNLSQYTTKTCGDGWLSIGDAIGFTNPFFSPGMTFGVATAGMAAYTTVYALNEYANNNNMIRENDCFDLYAAYTKRYSDTLFEEYRMHYLMFNHPKTFERCLLARIYFAINDTVAKTTIIDNKDNDDETYNKAIYASFDKSDCAPISVFFTPYVNMVKDVNKIMLKGSKHLNNELFQDDIVNQVSTIVNNALFTMDQQLNGKQYSGTSTYFAHYDDKFERMNHRHFLENGVVWFVQCDQCATWVDGTRDQCAVCSYDVKLNSTYEESIPEYATRTIQVTRSEDDTNQEAREVLDYFKQPSTKVMKTHHNTSKQSGQHKIARLKKKSSRKKTMMKNDKKTSNKMNNKIQKKVEKMNDMSTTNKMKESMNMNMNKTVVKRNESLERAHQVAPSNNLSLSQKKLKQKLSQLSIDTGHSQSANKVLEKNAGDNHLALPSEKANISQRPRPRTPPSHRRRSTIFDLEYNNLNRNPLVSPSKPSSPVSATNTINYNFNNNKIIDQSLNIHLRVEDLKRISILYATESGTSKRIAEELGSDLKHFLTTLKVDIIVNGLDQYSADELQNESLVIFIVSTYGDGDAPSQAQRFKFWIGNQVHHNRKVLKNLKFAVLGLGSSLYPKFCNFAKFLNTSMLQLGATSILPYTTADSNGNQIEQTNEWHKMVTSLLLSLFQLDTTNVKHRSTNEECPFDIEIGAIVLANRYFGESMISSKLLLDKIIDLRTCGLASCNDQIHPILNTLENVVRTSMNYDPNTNDKKYQVTRENPIVLHISANDELMDLEETSRSVRKITFELGNLKNYVDGLNINHGDNIGIYPVNPLQHVKEVARYLGIGDHLHHSFKLVPSKNQNHRHQLINSPFTKSMTFFKALSNYVDLLSPPSQRFIRFVKNYSSNTIESEELKFLANDYEHYQKWVQSETPNMLSFLLHFSNLQIPLATFFYAANSMQPRYYSISSSPKLTPDKITITVALKQYYNSRGRLCHGITSDWLRHLEPKSSWDTSGLVSVFCQPTLFKLPTNSLTPIIMIATGSGVAPFRSFWQERLYMKMYEKQQLGEAVLYFGCRQAAEHIYFDEMEDMVSKDILTVRVAYSRETNAKSNYIQNILIDDRDALAELIMDQNASIYVCGDVSVSSSAYNAICEVIRRARYLNKNDAKDYLELMKQQGRFHTEIFGSSSDEKSNSNKATHFSKTEKRTHPNYESNDVHQFSSAHKSIAA